MMMMGARDKDHVEYERSERSVFVGNIPYEATEDQLKDIFNEVGSVVSFRLVFDRESGKPKGYGFAEYQDKETAMSAMRNLNGRELHGRPLRVDHATSEKNRNTFVDETGPVRTSGPPMESEYGDPVPSKDAPEAISKAVASLPPEQMFELMRQMKQCIQNNPVEARNMLLQNPQLAYALLQAQVVMRIVDPEIAMKMLHCQNNTPPLIPGETKQDIPPEGAMNVAPGSGVPPSFNEGAVMGRMDPMEMARGDRGGFPMQPTRGGGGARIDGPMMAGGPPPMVDRVPVDGPPPQGGASMSGPPPHMVDGRHGYDGGPSRHHGMPDVGRPPSPERFGRGAEPQRGGGVIPPPNHQQQPNMMVDNFNQQRRLDPRSSAPDPRRPGGSRPNLERGGPGGGLSPHDAPQMMRGTVDRFPHEREDVKPPMDPRRAAAAASNNNPPAGGAIGSLLPQHMAHKLQQAAGGEEDAEKMKLIMQVLQLTPEQIDLLPEDQRENISALKQQFGL